LADKINLLFCHLQALRHSGAGRRRDGAAYWTWPTSETPLLSLLPAPTEVSIELQICRYSDTYRALLRPDCREPNRTKKKKRRESKNKRETTTTMGGGRGRNLRFFSRLLLLLLLHSSFGFSFIHSFFILLISFFPVPFIYLFFL
jgi:hypothetical protein